MEPGMPSSATNILRLSEVTTGTIARLHDVQLDREAHDVLRGLGLTDASVFRVCKQGEPCVVQVHATRIGLSSRVARQILVSLQAPIRPATA
jgi:Fe2+ transport system protein FeoA